MMERLIERMRGDRDQTGHGACDFCGATCEPLQNGAMICNQCRAALEEAARSLMCEEQNETRNT